MNFALVAHVATGLVGLTTGFVAVSAAKGGTLHRRSGLFFVYTMLVMSLLGAAIAAVELSERAHNPALAATVLMGLFTAYLVVTGLAAVRPASAWSGRLGVLGLFVAIGVGCAHVTLAIRALTDPASAQIVILTRVELIFGAIAFLAAASDLRILRSGSLAGAQRIARHLWRLTMALWIAAFSFFPRLTKHLPVPLRPLASAPIVIILVVLLYWMWRVRYRKSFRGLIGVTPTAREQLTSSTV